jgi:HEAT repeat protein
VYSAKPQLTPSNEEPSTTNKTSQNPADQASPDLDTSPPASQQDEIARRAVRDFLAGRSSELELPETLEKSVRESVEAELLIAIVESGPVEQSYARELFIERGFLDEAIQDLRMAGDPARRAAAARALGNVGSQRATAPLIAALFDDEPEVRRIAGEALAQIGDPAVAHTPMADLLNLIEETPGTDQLRPQEFPPAKEVEPTSVTTEPVQQAGEQMIAGDLSSITDDADLQQREEAVARAMKDIERRSLETAAARNEVDKEVRSRTEWETKFRAEVAIRRREEEEKLAAGQIARVEAEETAHSLAAEEARLRLEAANLRQIMSELSQKRADLEILAIEVAAAAGRAEVERARQEAEARHSAELERLRGEEQAVLRAIEETSLRSAGLVAKRQEAEAQVQRLEEEKLQLAAMEATRRSEAERMRREAEDKGRIEQERLLVQVAELRRLAEEVALRRSEIEIARQQTEEEAAQLLQTQSLMQAAEESRRQAEVERLELESELRQQVEAEQRLLEAARQRAKEEQQRLQVEAQQRASEEEQRLMELQAFLTALETAGREGLEKEQQITRQVEELRISETETRRRIEEAELRGRTAEESQRLLTEKIQNVEAEAHVRAVEEERMLAKLEEVRRNVAVEAQTRAEQERRIKEEIELLRNMEEEQRLQVEEENRRRVEAESRLQEAKNRLRAEEESRLRAEVQLNMLADRYRAAKAEAGDWQNEQGEGQLPVADEPGFGEGAAAAPSAFDSGTAAADKPHVVVADLNSVEPGKRAAALAALAQLSAKDAFSLIANCFDDQSAYVRNAAARALRDLEPRRMVESFTRALEEASPERRKNIGAAIADSGLAAEAINNLDAESREETYNALCLLFVMAKTGEVQPLVRAIEEHQNVEVRRAAIKLLTLSGQSEVADAAVKRHLDNYHGNGDSALPN